MWSFRLVVIALGLTCLACMVGSMSLAALGRTAPDGSIALGTGALGALATLLSNLVRPAPLK